MNGLETARQYYERFGEPMLKENFPDVFEIAAAGLCGSGSECFGYDDKVSEDHDFEPGFCIFIPGEDVISRSRAFELERAYASLPSEFNGYIRSRIPPVGGVRHGVIRVEDFLVSKTGTPDGKLDIRQWLSVPESALAEAVNGEIFSDPGGGFTSVRERLKTMPEDIRLKKLAGVLLIMAQSGLYNYTRCLNHGQSGAAQLAVIEFSSAAMHAAFLKNCVYMPYYKWRFRALGELEHKICDGFSAKLEYLISSPNDEKCRREKADIIQEIATAFCGGGNMELYAYAVNDSIKDSQIRNMHILVGVHDE